MRLELEFGMCILSYLKAPLVDRFTCLMLGLSQGPMQTQRMEGGNDLSATFYGEYLYRRRQFAQRRCRIRHRRRRIQEWLSVHPETLSDEQPRWSLPSPFPELLSTTYSNARVKRQAPSSPTHVNLIPRKLPQNLE